MRICLEEKKAGVLLMETTDINGEVERPGCVYVNIKHSKEHISEVKVGGTAVTILEGEMRF